MKINKDTATAFSQTLLDLYKEAQSLAPETFKTFALNRFSQLVPLDTAFWMIRSEVDTPYAHDESYTHNLPPQVLVQYIEYASVYEQSLLLNKALMDNLGTTIDVKSIIPQEEWLKSDIYLLLCKEYDIEHSIMTMYASEHNQMITNVSLSRHAHNPNFSEQERLLTQAFIPHLAEAHRINIIGNMNNHQVLAHSRGLVDKHGKIIEAADDFVETLIKAGFASDQQVHLQRLQQSAEQSTPYHCTINIESGLYRIEIYRRPLHELLPAKKMKVAELISKGYSNKAIALELHLSVETINDYVKDLYRLLEVNSRYQAIGCLLNMGV